MDWEVHNDLLCDHIYDTAEEIRLVSVIPYLYNTRSSTIMGSRSLMCVSVSIHHLVEEMVMLFCLHWMMLTTTEHLLLEMEWTLLILNEYQNNEIQF